MRIRRVVGSSLAVEALMAVDCVEAMKRMVEETMDVEAEELGFVVVMDASDLVKALASLRVVQEKRV